MIKVYLRDFFKGKQAPLLVAAAMAVLFACQAAPALAVERNVDDLPIPRSVAPLTAELMGLGCVQPTVRMVDNIGRRWDEFFATYPDGFLYVEPGDGLQDTDIAGNPDEVLELGLFCPADVRFAVEKRAQSTPPLTGIEATIVSVLNAFLELVANVGLWLLGVAGSFAAWFIPLGSFTTNAYVLKGWPFIQGLANLGFLLALLFIAGATTLRIQSFSVTKMLPRLLLAALLINFSLVIAGVLIDASRLLMAIMVNWMGGINSIGDLGKTIIDGSELIKSVMDATTGSIVAPGNTNWNIPLKIAEAALQIYALAIGFVLIAVVLIVRYVLLILLLIFSPFAYLAFAFPNMGKYATLWWTQFLTWVFYGPVVLFILLLLTVLPAGFKAANLADGPLVSLLNLGVTVGFLGIAYKFGKSFAGAAGAAAVGFTMGQAKRAGRFAYNNPKKTAAIVGGLPGLAAVGAGQFAGRLARDKIVRPARDYVSERTKPIRRTLGTGEYSPYDDKGKLKKNSSSYGSRAGSAPRRAEIAETQTALAAGGGAITAANIANPAFNANRLAQGHIVNALGPDEVTRNANVNFVLRNGTEQQARAITQNKDYLRDVSGNAGRLAAMEAEIRGNAAIPNVADREKVIAELYKTLDQIRNE